MANTLPSHMRPAALLQIGVTAPLLFLLGAVACSSPAAPEAAASGAVVAPKVAQAAKQTSTDPDASPSSLTLQGPSTMPGPPPRQAEETHSGLFTSLLREGTGAAGPRPQDSVSIRYTLWAADGRVMRHVGPTDPPQRVSLEDLPFGWSQGLRMMTVGEQRRLWIPAPLGWTDPGDARAGRLLVDVELVGVHRAAQRPHPPRDLTQPPPDAVRTTSGLAYEILADGQGLRNPGPDDFVRLQYAAWTTEGVMFRSSQRHGAERMRPRDLIEGWSEAIQRMVEGERIRVWIPESLAYHGQPGQPSGTLVFELHLLEILDAPQ